MSSPVREEELGRGKRTKEQTEKGQEYRQSLQKRATIQASPKAQSQTRIQGPSQFQSPAQAVPQITGPTTRSRSKNTTQSTNQTNASAIGGQGQPDSSGQGNNAPLATPTLPPLRRSKRNREQNEDPPGFSLPDGKGADKRRRVAKPEAAVEGFMIKLYAEIHHAATVRRVEQWERYHTENFLREARSVRFFDLFRDPILGRLRNRLDNFQSDDAKEKRVSELAKADADVTYAQKLIDFCGNPNFLLLTICAHSKSFREALKRTDDESRALGEAAWSDVYPKVKECASSLELFARTHRFNWANALYTCNDHFTNLLAIVYNGCSYTSGKNGENFGIGPQDLQGIHDIGDEDKHKVHHHWVLPLQDRGPAVWPSIEVTITQDLISDGFMNGNLAIDGLPEDPKKGEDLAVNPASIHRLGSKHTIQQFNIEQSIILPNYTWPDETHRFIDADRAIYENPTFCGFLKHPCHACKTRQPADNVIDLTDDPDTINVVHSSKEPSEQGRKEDRACKCTFADLCRRENKSPLDNHRDILVELYTTKEKGRGVRALQNIPRDTFLGEYVGEIYSVQRDEDDGPGTMVNHRYGQETYHMQVDIARAADYAVKKNKGKKSETTISGEDRPQWVVDALHRGNWTRYTNHSCVPNTHYVAVNVGQRTAMVVTTIKAIKFGEEITVDYGDYYFENLGIPCRCGEKTCKHTDVGVGWRG